MKDELNKTNSYAAVSSLKPDHSVILLKDMKSGEFFVKKELSIYNASVYQFLYSHPMTGVPGIISMEETSNHLSIIEQFIPGTSLQLI
jgi:hypothetical protein